MFIDYRARKPDTGKTGTYVPPVICAMARQRTAGAFDSRA